MPTKTPTLEKPSTQSAIKSGDAKRATLVQPYVFFGGRTEEAIAFYRQALGAEVVMLMRFKDAPPPSADCAAGGPPMPPNWGEKVMHAEIKIGSSSLLASDGCGEKPAYQGFSLSLTLPTAQEAEKRFKALGEGGQVQMPLGKTFFSASFGMLADKFGVGWMIYVAP